MWLALVSICASLAAQPAPTAATSINATVASGVTAAQIAAATSPIPVLTFTYQKVAWTVACKGAASALSCTAAAGATKGTVKGGTASSVILNLGGQDIEIKATASPVVFSALTNNENITE